ncbi:MAG: hypothetical protein AAF502_24890 [Bacteroidota bacterium]
MRFFSFLLSILFITACSTSQIWKPEAPLDHAYTEVVSEYGFNYMESLGAWEKLKAENGNSYVYRISYASWVGYHNYTEISVRNGKIVSRKYEEFSPGKMVDEDGNSVKNPDDITYVENQDQINSNSQGFHAVLFEELYKSCGKDYIIEDPQWNSISFDTNEEGIMTLCGYTPNNCADDCFRGLYVSEFSWSR